jgi:hypothetical protein
LQICLRLEAHQRREDDAPPLHPLGTCEFGLEVGYRLLIERRLLASQVAEGPQLGLVRQVGDDGLVGLQPAQDVRTHECAQWGVGVVRL